MLRLPACLCLFVPACACLRLLVPACACLCLLVPACACVCLQEPGNCDFQPTRVVPDEYEARWAALRPRLQAAECEAMDEIMRLVGLRQVKATALNLFEILLANRELHQHGHPKAATSMTLNFVFLGNPGYARACVRASVSCVRACVRVVGAYLRVVGGVRVFACRGCVRFVLWRVEGGGRRGDSGGARPRTQRGVMVWRRDFVGLRGWASPNHVTCCFRHRSRLLFVALTAPTLLRRGLLLLLQDGQDDGGPAVQPAAVPDRRARRVRPLS